MTYFISTRTYGKCVCGVSFKQLVNSIARNLPRFSARFHVVGQRDVVRPNVILPLSEAQHPAEHPSRMYAHPHVELHVGGFHDAGYGVYHVEAHLHGAVGMVRSRLRQTGNAVVAVAQNFYPEAVIVLLEGAKGAKWRKLLKDKPERPGSYVTRVQCTWRSHSTVKVVF